jgi:hypothetical protein
MPSSSSKIWSQEAFCALLFNFLNLINEQVYGHSTQGTEQNTIGTLYYILYIIYFNLMTMKNDFYIIMALKELTIAEHK